ncbi:MAG TPA: branched-chain amino acid ABC transporter permease [Mycobacteriales bacterium]|nr:branched-chain amino acid ABC transporter permease [Mycobacteriales bacterium]
MKVVAGSGLHKGLRAGASTLGVLVAVGIPFNSSPVLNGQLTLVLSYAVAAIGLGLLVGYGGQISLGHGAFFAVGAYAAAAVLAKTGLPYLLAVPVAAAVAFLLGLAFGVPALRLRGLYLALVTLALAVAAGPVIKRAEPLTGGVSGLAVPQPPVPGWLAVDPDQWLYLLSLAVTGLMLLLAVNLTRGSLGRSLVAIRDGERAARTAGVDVARVKALLFACAGAYAGVGGALFAYGQGFVAPESFTLLLSFTFLGAVVVGGLGTVAGGVLGALFVVFVPQYAGDVNQALTGVIYGATLIAVVYLLPGGAAGLLRRVGRLLIQVVEPSPPPDTQRGAPDAVATSDPAPAGHDPAGSGVRP